MIKQKYRLPILLGVLGVVAIAWASSNKFPIFNGLLQSDLDGGGYNIANVASMTATSFHGDGSALTGISGVGGGTNYLSTGLTITNNTGAAPLTVKTTNGDAILSTDGSWKVANPGSPSAVSYGVRGDKTNGIYFIFTGGLDLLAFSSYGTNAETLGPTGETNAGPIYARAFYGNGAGLTNLPSSSGTGSSNLVDVLSNVVVRAGSKIVGDGSGLTNLTGAASYTLASSTNYFVRPSNITGYVANNSVNTNTGLSFPLTFTNVASGTNKGCVIAKVRTVINQANVTPVLRYWFYANTNSMQTDGAAFTSYYTNGPVSYGYIDVGPLTAGTDCSFSVATDTPLSLVSADGNVYVQIQVLNNWTPASGSTIFTELVTEQH